VLSVTKFPENWSTAKSKCEEMEAHLIYLDSEEAFLWFIEIRNELRLNGTYGQIENKLKL